MAAGIVTFKVTGLGSLLMNNPGSMEEESNSITKTRTKKETPQEEASKRLYLLNDAGELYLPAIAFLNSLWEGASYEKIGKDSARNRIQSAIFVMEEKIPLLNKDNGQPIIDYTIDSRHVVIKATKGRIMRHRPRVENWMCLVPFEVEQDLITVDQIIHLFKKSGRVIGVMDYRPAKRGPFGRYDCEVYVPSPVIRRK